MRRLQLLLVFVLAACASAQRGSDGAAFRRVQTEHFTLYTDLDDASATAQAVHLERLLDAFRQHGFRGGDRELATKLNVVMFASQFDFARYGGERYLGYMTTKLFEPWIVLPAPSRTRGLETLLHELTHYLAYLAIQKQSAWLAEGLATYFETAYLDESTVFALGSVPMERATALQRSGMMPVRELMSPNVDKDDPRFYGSAWLVVHYLMSERAEEFAYYQQALARGESEEAAWQAAFAKLSQDALQDQLTVYLRRGEFFTFSLPIEEHVVMSSVSPLSKADELALEAVLWSTAMGVGEAVRQPRAQRAASEALTLDSRQPQALSMRLDADPDVKSRITRAGVAARSNPDSWLAWMTLTMALSEARELNRSVRPDPVAHLMRLAPRHPYSWLAAAVQHAGSGEREHALRCAKKAHNLAPTDPELMQVEAELLTQLRACDELDSVLRTLRNLDGATKTANYESLTSRCREASL